MPHSSQWTPARVSALVPLNLVFPCSNPRSSLQPKRLLKHAFSFNFFADRHSVPTVKKLIIIIAVAVVIANTYGKFYYVLGPVLRTLYLLTNLILTTLHTLIIQMRKLRLRKHLQGLYINPCPILNSLVRLIVVHTSDGVHSGTSLTRSSPPMASIPACNYILF